MTLSRNKRIMGETFLAMLEREFYVDIPVYGLSMFPFYLPGDKVRIVKANKDNLVVGNVVVFVLQDRLVAHRLLYIDFTCEQAVTKGDGLLKKDTLLRCEAIRGVVFSHYRNEIEVKFINRPFVKRSIACLSPMLGYISFPFSRIWYKISKR